MLQPPHMHTQVTAVSTETTSCGVLHVLRRVTVQAVMFRDLCLLRLMFTVLAGLQQTIIFTPRAIGPLSCFLYKCING